MNDHSARRAASAKVLNMAATAAAAAAASKSGFESEADFDEKQRLEDFLSEAMWDIKESDARNFRVPAVPLARVKKIMKLDENVNMISQEAPQFLSKAVELFVTDITNRAWTVTLVRAFVDP